MATANFWWLHNAKAIYTFWIWADELESEFVYNDTKDNIQTDLQKAWFSLEDEWMENDKKLIASNSFDFAYRDSLWLRQWEFMRVDVFIESWYYEGARVDWVYTHDVDDMTKKAYKRTQKQNKILDKICEAYTTPIKKVGQFSNGEAVYELA